MWGWLARDGGLDVDADGDSDGKGQGDLYRDIEGDGESMLNMFVYVCVWQGRLCAVAMLLHSDGVLPLRSAVRGSPRW